MDKLKNIDWNSIKAFVKGNVPLCVLAVLDIVLFFTALGCGNMRRTLQEKISSLQVKEQQIKVHLGKLTGLEKDFENLKNLKSDIFKGCINFGKKSNVYNLLKQIDGFLHKKNLNVSNADLYNINKNRNINPNQDLLEFDGDNIVAKYNTSFSGTPEDLATFLEKLNQLPYFINLQKLEIKNNSANNVTLLNVNLSFALLGKIQLKE